MYKNTPGPEGPRGAEKGLGRKRPKQKALPAGRSLPQAGPKGLSPWWSQRRTGAKTGCSAGW